MDLWLAVTVNPAVSEQKYVHHTQTPFVDESNRRTLNETKLMPYQAVKELDHSSNPAEKRPYNQAHAQPTLDHTYNSNLNIVT